MRSIRPSAAAEALESHVCALHAQAIFLTRAWRVRVCGARAVATAKRRFDRVVARRFQNMAQ
eukprot:8054183-Lingulodinium_polyedra.AAC.1